MGILDDLKLKGEGKLDQAKGEIQQRRGKGMKGGYHKVRGKIKEAAADAKMKTRKDAENIIDDDII